MGPLLSVLVYNSNKHFHARYSRLDEPSDRRLHSIPSVIYFFGYRTTWHLVENNFCTITPQGKAGTKRDTSARRNTSHSQGTVVADRSLSNIINCTIISLFPVFIIYRCHVISQPFAVTILIFMYIFHRHTASPHSCSLLSFIILPQIIYFMYFQPLTSSI